MLDTERRIATPEGIELTLRIAGPVPRALAWVVDFLIRFAALVALSMVVGFLGRFGWALFILAAFLLEWLYPVWFEVYRGGATPGKRAFKLVVLNDDGTPVRAPASLTRNLLRVVDFLPALYGFGLASMLVNRDFKRLGDLAAGTIVAYREAKPRAFEVPAAPVLAPPVALSVAEQRAILDFAERSPGLTDERAEELAELAPTLVRGASGSAASKQLLGIANHLVGRR